MQLLLKDIFLNIMWPWSLEVKVCWCLGNVWSAPSSMQYLVKAPATSIMMELWRHTTHFIMTGSFFISSKATMWNIIQLQYIASYISLLSRKRKLFSWAINYYISYDHDDVQLKTLFEGYLALFPTAVASLLFCEYTSSGDSSKYWKSWPSST